MLAKIWNFSGWITETEPLKLRVKCDYILTEAGFHILGENTHYFQPQGYTKLYLLSESHFAIHTFPEKGKTYIELSSCNEIMYNKAVKLIKEKFTFTESD